MEATRLRPEASHQPIILIRHRPPAHRRIGKVTRPRHILRRLPLHTTWLLLHKTAWWLPVHHLIHKRIYPRQVEAGDAPSVLYSSFSASCSYWEPWASLPISTICSPGSAIVVPHPLQEGHPRLRLRNKRIASSHNTTTILIIMNIRGLIIFARILPTIETL